MKLNKLVVASIIALSANAAFSMNVDEIVHNVDVRDTGKTSTANMSMSIQDRGGNVRNRTLVSYKKDYGSQDSMLIQFLAPSDVKGSSFLSVDKKKSSDDDAWIFLPSLNNVKRVSQTNRSDSFMGSDFSYSDITGTEVYDWNYKLVSESDPVDGKDCWVLESTPKTSSAQSETGYAKRQIWVRKDNFYVVRGLFFPAKGGEVKKMSAQNLRQINGVWTPASITMATTKGDRVVSKSVIQFSNVVYNKALADDLFSQNSLMVGVQ